MSLITNFIRRIEKCSTVGGQVPTIPISNDHTNGDWIVTDIYEGELFLNIPDKKLYTRTGENIVLINMSEADVISIIENYVGTNTDKQPTIVVIKEKKTDIATGTSLEEAFEKLTSPNGSGGTIVFGASISLTQNWSFDHTGITLRGNGKAIVFGGYKITITNREADYANFRFVGRADSLNTTETLFVLNNNSGGTSQFFFSNCRFVNCIDLNYNSIPIFDASTMSDSVHFTFNNVLIDVTTGETINNKYLGIKTSATSGAASISSFLCKSNPDYVFQTNKIGWIGSLKTSGCTFNTDGSTIYDGLTLGVNDKTLCVLDYPLITYRTEKTTLVANDLFLVFDSETNKLKYVKKSNLGGDTGLETRVTTLEGEMDTAQTDIGNLQTSVSNKQDKALITTNFNKNLSPTENTVQKAFDKLDDADLGHAIKQDGGTTFTQRGILDFKGFQTLKISDNSGAGSTDITSLVTDGWLLNTASFTRDSTSQITFTGVDFTKYLAYAIKVTDNSSNVTYNFIKTAVYTTNTVCTVLGTALPATITKIEFKRCNHPERYSFWDGVLNNSPLPTDLASESENKYSQRIITLSKSRIVAIRFNTVNIGTNTSGATVNFTIDGTNNILTSNLTLATGLVECGVTINNTYSQIKLGDIFKCKVVTATGASDVSGGYFEFISVSEGI